MRMMVLAAAVLLTMMKEGGSQSVCALENFTLHVERHECGYCMAINTTICSGLCYTQDTNMRGFVGPKFLMQRGCMHRSVVYRAARMPGCPLHINPLFFYPVARRCRCTKCNTVRNECIHKTHWVNKCSKHLRAA